MAWGLGPVLLYFGLAVLGAIIPHGDRADINSDDATHDIILVAGLIHYDILLPADDATLAAFGFVKDANVPLDNPLVRWVAIGWGSEAFYTTTGSYANLTVPTVWKALTGDAGVIRFEVTGTLPVHPRLRRVRVSDAQLNALRASIRADLDPAPNALPLDGFSQTDAFYPAAGRFNVFRTCNVWVADKLADAGLGFGAWTPTPYAVTLSLWWNGHLTR